MLINRVIQKHHHHLQSHDVARHIIVYIYLVVYKNLSVHFGQGSELRLCMHPSVQNYINHWSYWKKLTKSKGIVVEQATSQKKSIIMDLFNMQNDCGFIMDSSVLDNSLWTRLVLDKNKHIHKCSTLVRKVLLLRI